MGKFLLAKDFLKYVKYAFKSPFSKPDAERKKEYITSYGSSIIVFFILSLSGLLLFSTFIIAAMDFYNKQLNIYDFIYPIIYILVTTLIFVGYVIVFLYTIEVFIDKNDELNKE